MWKNDFKYSLNKFSFINNKGLVFLYGNFGIVALTTGFVTQNNIENLRRKLAKQLKKINKINKSKIFFRLPIWKGYTKKPLLSRMGKGAGNIVGWKAFLKRGSIFMEILSVLHSFTIFKIFKRAIKCFPLKILLLKRGGFHF